MKRSFSYLGPVLVMSSTALIAATYGLVRLAYGLLLPDVQDSLGLTVAGAGAISAGASVSYCVAALIGMLAVAAAPRWLVIGAAGTAGLGAIGMALAPGRPVFAIACVIASAGAGSASPALVALVARTVRSERVGSAQSAVNAGTGIGLVVAGLLAFAVLPDWRTAWAISGVVALVAGAAVLLADGRSRARRDTHSAAASSIGTRRFPPADWWRRHVRVVVAAFLLGAASAAVWNSGRAVLGDAGVDRGSSVLAWVAIGFGGVVVVITAKALDRLEPRTAWIATSSALALATAGLVVAPTVLPLVLGVCVLFGWGYTAATGALIAWTASIDRDRAASGTAMLFVVLVGGQAVGAVVGGALVQVGGFVPVFVGAALVAAAGAAVALTRTLARAPAPVG